MNKKTRSPRERRHERTRQDILNAALELVIEQGADNLSLREIARRVDYSPAGLYEYFGSKEEIIAAVCQQAGERFMQAIKAVDDTQDLRDYIIEIGLAYIRFARENSEEFIFLNSNYVTENVGMERLNLDDPADMEMLINPDNSFGLLYHAVNRAVNAGLFKTSDDFNTMDMVYSFWSLVHGMSMLQVRHLKHFPYDFLKMDRKAIEALLDGLN